MDIYRLLVGLALVLTATTFVMATEKDTMLSQLLLIFGDCWTELVVDNMDESLLISEVKYPVIFSSSVSVPYFPLYSGSDAGHTYKLKPKCVAIILIPEGWKPNAELEVIRNLLQRYSYMKMPFVRGNPIMWNEKPFKSRNSFLVGIFNSNNISSKSLVVDMQSVFSCIVIQVIREGTTNKIEYNPQNERNIGYFMLELTKSTTLNTLQHSLYYHLLLNSKNITRSFNVISLKYWLNYFWRNEPVCLPNPPSPSSLMHFTDLRTTNLNFLKLVLGFLIHGRYGVSQLDYSTNVNSGHCFDSKGVKMRNAAGFVYVYMRDAMLYDQFLDINVNKPEAKEIRVLTSSFLNEFNFITCDGRTQQGNSYSIFLTSFDPGLRISLLVFAIIFVCIVYYIVWKLGSSDSPWLVIYPILLEISPQLSPKLSSNISFLLVLIPTTFTGILIANGYKGVLTTDLTAPLPWKRLETFNDVLKANFSIFGDLDFVLTHKHKNQFCNKVYSHMHSKKILLTHTILIKELNKLIGHGSKKSNVSKTRAEILSEIKSQFKFPQLKGLCSMFRVSLHVPALDIQSELLECKRSVYVIRSDEAYHQITRMNSTNLLYHGKSESMGLFKFNYQQYAFLFQESSLDEILMKRNVDALTTGGFLFYWEHLTMWPSIKSDNQKEDKFHRQTAQPQPMTLSVKTGTMFIIFLAGILIGMLGLIMECTYCLESSFLFRDLLIAGYFLLRIWKIKYTSVAALICTLIIIVVLLTLYLKLKNEGRRN